MSFDLAVRLRRKRVTAARVVLVAGGLEVVTTTVEVGENSVVEVGSVLEVGGTLEDRVVDEVTGVELEVEVELRTRLLLVGGGRRAGLDTTWCAR